ncbi:hypothetical protein H5410_019492 [Solanum commersonii]|uniref:Uncharacterized protein n=1 Tax=Solanum commersonii TaxID=4109 RepID=A0A9J5Z5E3_SOLCO|nr:hypothetical protein H5410_019492 [Solanum commersonii]
MGLVVIRLKVSSSESDESCCLPSIASMLITEYMLSLSDMNLAAEIKGIHDQVKELRSSNQALQAIPVIEHHKKGEVTQV